MKETQVQAECAELYRLHGGLIYDLSQGYRPGTAKHATTRQTPGLADLWIFFPGGPSTRVEARAWVDVNLNGGKP